MLTASILLITCGILNIFLHLGYKNESVQHVDINKTISGSDDYTYEISLSEYSGIVCIGSYVSNGSFCIFLEDSDNAQIGFDCMDSGSNNDIYIDGRNHNYPAQDTIYLILQNSESSYISVELDLRIEYYSYGIVSEIALIFSILFLVLGSLILIVLFIKIKIL